jgi:DNA invertase Pin-like site-specific DNA recombinase
MLGIYARTSRDNPLEVVSTIDQQIKAGIEFANKNGFEYRVYADKGISGYKIADEEDKDPFNNRPEFTKLINDIKQGLVDCVWVWEHSRISRNQYASAYIFNIFQNNKITLYEKDKEFNLSDPTNQMLRQILDAVAQYERQLIVGRTTRGLYNAINSGKRAHAKFFGYKRVGRDKNGNLIWEPVESEIEQLKSWYKQYQEGKSLRSIILNQISKKSEIETQVLLQRATKLGRFLAHAEYTGYNLNMKGLEVLHKFEKCEIGEKDFLCQRQKHICDDKKLIDSSIVMLDENIVKSTSSEGYSKESENQNKKFYESLEKSEDYENVKKLILKYFNPQPISHEEITVNVFEQP